MSIKQRVKNLGIIYTSVDNINCNHNYWVLYVKQIIHKGKKIVKSKSEFISHAQHYLPLPGYQPLYKFSLILTYFYTIHIRLSMFIPYLRTNFSSLKLDDVCVIMGIGW